MAVTTDPFDSTELAAVIPEVWTPLVNEKFFDETVLADFITDLSEYAQDGGDIFHVPNIYTNSFSVGTQSTQGAEITTDAPAQVDVTLTVNTHKYVAYLIGDKDMKQIATKYNINAIYTRQAAGLLAEALEADIAALWSSLTTNTVGDTATVVTDAEIRQAIYKLEAQKVMLNECAFFFHPYTYWNQIHAITKYYQQYSFGPANQAGMAATGNFNSVRRNKSYKGELYGMPVYTTNNIVSGLQTYRNMLLHPLAFGFALQTKGGGKIRVQTDNLVQNLGMLTVVDIVYGVAALRESVGVLINGSSSFIGS
jgi:hypothetical protein